MDEIQRAKWVIPPQLNVIFQKFCSLYSSLYGPSNTSKKLPVMIIGPPGVGKTLFSESFAKLYQHDYKVKDDKIRRTNIAAIPDTLIESHLFGHKKGSFTGADRDYAGLFGELKNGILILDEIGELSKKVQTKLLTFIEEGYYYSIGDSTKKESKGLQIIATTNKSFDDGVFRQDFFDRFFPFYIPSLCKRRKDILYYWAHYFPELLVKLSPCEILSILAYNWPGNVREIERVGNVIKWIFFHDEQHDSRQAWYSKQPLYKIKDGYSEISIWKVHEIIEGLYKFGFNLNSVEKVLNKFGVGFEYGVKDHFPLSKFNKYLRESGTLSLSGIGTSLIFEKNKLFELAYKGLSTYCALFRQDIHGDYNLLDIFNNEFMDPDDCYPNELNKISFENRERLIKDSLQLTYEIETERSQKETVAPSKPKTKQNIPDLLSMTKDQLIKFYLVGVLDKKHGNKKRAAKIADVPYSTFVSMCKKYEL